VRDPNTMSRRTSWLIGTVFTVLVVAAAAAPLSLMLLPNPVPIVVADVASQPSGAYITTQGRTYRVFPRAEQVAQFPEGSPSVSSTPLLSIKSEQLDQPSSYGLFAFDGSAIAVTRTAVQRNVLALRPVTPLRPGRYFAQIAREGMFGGTDFVYFSVTSTVGPAAN
jgi:hypothetical protein